MRDVLALPASTMLALLAKGEISSLDLTEAVIARIEAVNPVLNAVTGWGADTAREEARFRDEQRCSGAALGRLHGLPMTIKDSFETAGMASTAGTPGRADFVPERDATAIARLRAEGAILVAKTSTPELTLRFETENRLIGRTKNPYDPQRSPGGSSGGAAALIAAAASPFDIGSDTGGSIRLPAHFCGIAGLKPTAGRVSRAGHVPNLEFPLVESFTQIGPLARSVADLAMLYPVLAGADPLDPFTPPMPLEAETKPIADLRVATYADNGLTAVCPETQETLAAALRALEGAGAVITEAAPPGVERSDALWRALFLADGGAAVIDALTLYGAPSPDPLIAWTQAQPPIGMRELAPLLRDWAALRRGAALFFQTVDCIVCPVNSEAAPIAGEAVHANYTQHYNLVGCPVAVVRCGTTATGLPIGLQIAAPAWREDACLAIAGFLESALGGWRAPDLSAAVGGTG